MRTTTSSQDAWGAGDVCAVPDLTGGGVGGYSAQRAARGAAGQAASRRTWSRRIRGEDPSTTSHKNQGAVAGIGLYIGSLPDAGSLAIKGIIAWVMHRGYHGLAMPMWERKIRVFGNWIINFLSRRDMVGLREGPLVPAQPSREVRSPAEELDPTPIRHPRADLKLA